MALIHTQYTEEQADFMVDLFKILAPTKQDCHWGTNPKLIGHNFIDGGYNPQYGVVVNLIINRAPDTQFFAASDLLNGWFLQQVVLFSEVGFIKDTGGSYPPRAASMIRVPVDWNYRMEKDLMQVSRKDIFQYLIDRVQFLFHDDPDMSIKVQALVLPE